MNPNANRKLRVISFVTALSLSISFISIPTAVAAEDDSILALQAQYDKLEKEIAKNKKKLEENEKDRLDQKAIVSDIESEISGLNSQITILDKKISLLNDEIIGLNTSIYTLDNDIQTLSERITQTNDEIEESKIQINVTKDKLVERLSKSYMLGTASTLEMLLGAKSLAEILTWQQYIKNASDYDNSMIEDLETNVSTLQTLQEDLDLCIETLETKKHEAEEQKTDLEAKQQDVEESNKDLESKKNSANEKRNEAYALLKTMSAESKEYQKLDAEMRAEEERIDAEMNARLTKIASVYVEPTASTTTATTTVPTTTQPQTTAVPETDAEGNTVEAPTETTTVPTTEAQTIPPSASTTPPTKRNMICPIQNKSAIVSGTYPRYENGGVHHGIDIVLTEQGRTLGCDIVAPLDGKVITIGYGDASRGNYFEIDHGEGLVTRYYHCSSILVAMGQTVKQGQTIAKVGDTGRVTGPHLHFEVLLNTTSGLIRQNPLSYISVP